MLKLSVFCLLVVFTSNTMAHRRKLSSLINPNCKDPSCDLKNETLNTTLLVHVRADGDNDTLHHIWDFTGSPSLLLVRTDRDCVLTVTWDKYIKANGTSVTFSSKPIYTFGVILDRVFEFNDESNSGIFNVNSNNESYVHVIETSDFHWKLDQSALNDTDTALLSLIGKRYDHKTNKTGIIRIAMGAFSGDEHGESLPHLLHSSNSSQMDVSLENMPTYFEKSRYGVGLVTISSDHFNATMSLDVKETIDDEHTPGVFSVVEVTSPEARFVEKDDDSAINGGFVQWRPIVFTSAAHDITNSSDAVHYGVAPLTDVGRLRKTLFYKLFGDKLEHHLISTTNITFGNSDDKFYPATNFASWTFVAGIGRPMEEQLSRFVWVVIIGAVALTLTFVIVGIICVVARRILKNKDDLFLSQ